jgi:hypothetical protein
LEPLRPRIDDFLIELIRNHAFRRDDFYETKRGVFRVGPELAKFLADTMPMWRREVAPTIEMVADTIANSSDRPIRISTKLTQDARSHGRDGVRKGERRQPLHVSPNLPRVCRSCGVTLTTSSRRYCVECFPVVKVEQVAEFAGSGPVALAKLRSEGLDPTRTADALMRLSNSRAATAAADAAWDRKHPVKPDPEIFRREVLPTIQGVPLSKLVEATGLSRRAVSSIRSGQSTPHPRHWECLQRFGMAKP